MADRPTREGDACSVFTMKVLDAVSFDSLWNKFAERHGDWLQRLPPDEPLYALTPALIEHLKRGDDDRPAVLDRDAAEAEHALLEICQQSNAVGSWKGIPISYPLLSPPPNPFLSDELKQELKWTPRQQIGYSKCIRRMERSELRLKGYAGWLLTEPAFLEARESLKAAWHKLPESQRPSFPLERPVHLPQLPPHVVPAQHRLAQFAQELEAFLNRWGLIALATWDLPTPQGPMVPLTLPLAAPAWPRHGIFLYIPLHYPLTGGNDRLLDQVLELQRSKVQELGIDTSSAGLPHYQIYGKLLELIHLEKAVVQRYGQPPGLITVLEEALATSLDVGVNHIQRLRKGVARCRKGDRSKVDWLNSRA
jgi:hypothetical protein